MRDKILRLGVNIDHIATVRQARKTQYPDPLEAALLAQKAGAHGITAHLREDKRHIQNQDVVRLKSNINLPLNLEMAVTDTMLEFALEIQPAYCCLVPEKRQELTTEGGLNVVMYLDQVKHACALLQEQGIKVSLFIDPEEEQMQAAMMCNAKAIEIHTGCYADATSKSKREYELNRIINIAKCAHNEGLIVNAGHGLHYQNVQAIAAIEELNELNIGHSIIARAMMVGMEVAVKEMLECMS